MNSKDLSPGKKAQKTAKWAHIMTKWLITYSHQSGVRWNLVEFGGKTGTESRGIVDLIAVRKNHQKQHISGLKSGDLLDIILIQVKGGSAPRPTKEDMERLWKVAKYHRAKYVVLAEWYKGKQAIFSKLTRTKWIPVVPDDVFG